LLKTPVQAQGSSSIWAQYTIKLPRRDAAAEAPRQQGIPTQI
jgi:hypothetical protein